MRSCRISRSTRLRPTRMPSRASMAWMRGAPYVRRDRSQMASIRSPSAASATARGDRSRLVRS